MNYFAYKAIDPDGVMVRGVTPAENRNAVFAALSTQGLSIIDVKRANAIAAFLSKAGTARKIKRTEVIEFAANLSVMLKAGVPIVAAFDEILGTLENRWVKKAVSDMKAGIEAGMRFSDAIEAQREIFPGILVGLVRAGEETGRLDKSLAAAANHLQKMEDLSQTIRRAMIYPTITVFMTLGALIFWIAYVLPSIMNVMKDMGVKLPLITRMLIQAGAFAKVYWYVIPLAFVAVISAVNVLKRNDKVGYYIDLLKIKLPVVKLVVYNKLLVLFSEQFRILVMSGITIDRSLGITADVMGNKVFQRALLESKESVSAGNSIAGSLKAHKEFPQLVIRMVRTGETSGSLEEQLGFLSDYYMKKLDDISQRLGKMMEPIVIAIAGIMFAVIVIGLLLPIYDLAMHLGNR